MLYKNIYIDSYIKMEQYKNKIYLIGKDLYDIRNILKLYQDLNNNEITGFWEINTLDWNNIIPQLKEDINNADYRMEKYSNTIIFSMDILNNNEIRNVETLVQNFVILFENDEYYFPFLVFLIQNEEDKNKIENIFQNKSIDPRNISFFISPLKNDDNKKNNIQLIRNKLFEIFSYYYGLGDEIKIGNFLPIKLYKGADGLLPVNVLVLGKTQVGKSTFINTILKSKKAKEGDNASSETEKKFSYHIDNVPLLLNDIEGFTGENNIHKIVKLIKSMQVEFEEKELHLIIYVLRYDSLTYFNDNEYEIFKQLSANHHQSHFIFVCTKSENNDKKKRAEYKKIRRSFFNMIIKGNEKELKSKENKIDSFLNTLNYLYYCQKKEIEYNEISDENKIGITEEKFKKMDFYQQMSLKFKGVKDEAKYNEMVETIIEMNKNLIFVNLKVDERNKKLFGMDKVSEQIISALSNIRHINLKILNTELKTNENKLESLNKSLGIINDDDEQKEKLIDKRKELEELTSIKEGYEKLIESLKNNDLENCKDLTKILKQKLINQAYKDVLAHKIAGWISGIIPFGDILIQDYLKEKAKNKIAKRFEDSALDLNKKNYFLTKDEKNKIDELKEEVDDKISNGFKSFGRAITIGINIFTKISFVPLALIGIIIGVSVGGKVTKDDINAFINFYGNRFVYRCLITLSFKKIKFYLKENFQKNEIN